MPYKTEVASKVALAAAILVVFTLCRNSLVGELNKIWAILHVKNS